MKRFPILFVAALMTAAVSAPAQRRGDVRGDRHVRGGIVSARQHVGAQHASRHAARPAVTRNVTRRGYERGYERGNRRGYARGVRAADPYCGTTRCAPVRRSHGYWKTVCEPVLVEAGHWHQVHVPAVYGWTYDACGLRVWGVIEPACYKREWHPPRYEQRTRRIWVSY